MRELHVVAVSEDGRHVLLGPTKGAKTGTHRVRLDARLVAAVRGELRSADAPEVDLSPKEIQARLRAGESAEQIAESAGLPVTKVARFAGPVAGEMARTIDAARDAFVVRGRRGRSTVPLGKAVDAALEQVEGPTWSTRREEDGRWRVAVRWTARGRAREAAWWYEPGRTELAPVDPASAALGHVDAEPVRRTAPAKPAARKAAAPASPRPKAEPAAPARKRARAAEPAAPPPPPAKPRKATKKAAPAPKAPARPRLKVVPDPPAATRATQRSAPADRQAQRDGVVSRASIPSWEDVLLGTTPGGER